MTSSAAPVSPSLPTESSHEAHDTVAALLASVDGTPATYLGAARQFAHLGENTKLAPVRVALLSTFTIDLVAPYLTVECARRGLGARLTFGAFGQLEQQVLDPTSALYAASPDVIVLAVRIEDVAPALVDGFAGLSADAIATQIDGHVARVEQLLGAIRKHSNAQVLVWNQPPPARVTAGLADAALTPSQADTTTDLNRKLAVTCRTAPGAFVFDAARLAAEVGLHAWYDPKLRHLGRIPFGFAAQVAIAQRLARYLNALTRPPKKCLVLDLDNTLWGGVLGEDGLGGIRLGEDYPGNVFKTFQREVRSYRDRGVLLAIASKNNLPDVVDAFEKHDDMVLRLDDFAARQVHWNDKAQSLAAIASELSIGTDSLVFFDDNPVEREWVKSRMPEVLVVDVPTDPLRYGAALDAAGAFDHLVVTAEDRQRAQQYQQEAKRRDLEVSAGSVDEFLRALEMRITLGAIDAATLPRVAQLLAKTNQFNVTTRRHTAADLERMLAAGAIGLWMRIADRFGDNGLVGVAIAVERSPGEWVIDSFLMSCRVLGRKAELALLAAVTRRLVARGARRLLGEFIPSKKNAPAADFYASAGFVAVPDSSGFWRRDLDERRDLDDAKPIFAESFATIDDPLVSPRAP
jgi:FkbH-like protein